MTVAEPPRRLDAPLVIGEWRVDPRADEIESGGRVIKLEPLRMRLLMALAERPGEVVLSNELLDNVWKGVIVTPGSLYQSVAQLRQLLGDSATEPRYIVTVPRKGYRLVAPVSPLPIRPPPAMPSQPGAPPAAADTAQPSTSPSEQPTPRIARAVEPAAAPVSAVTFKRRDLVAGSVAAGALVAGGAWWWNSRPAPGPVRIAVLPFTDRSAARLDQSLANGVTEDVIRTLGRHPALEVMAFDAVARLAQAADVLAEAARRLDVAFALTGELLRAGERVRITTQLVALPAEKVRLSVSFDESMSQLSNVPQAIAQKAIAALDLKPVVTEANPGPSSAYEMSVLGFDALRTKTSDSIARARRYFSAGIQIDALYARNYAGLGWSWLFEYHYVGGQLDWPEAYARAEPLFSRALQLDRELLDAKLGLANVARQHGRYEESRRIFEAIIKAHPNNVPAHFGLALADDYSGFPARALTHYERAASLDPTQPQFPVGAGLQLMYLGRLGEAEARFKRSIELDASRPQGFYSLGILHWLRGRLDEAVAAYREALKRNDGLSYVWADYAFVCTDLGLYEEAQRAFSRTGELLRAPNWALVEAAFVWVAEGAAQPAPPVLEDSVSSPAPWERLLILTMGGDKLSIAAVRSVHAEQSSYVARPTTLYDIVSGRFRALDIASLFVTVGERDQTAQLLDETERTLNEYEQRGVTAPALSFHRARVLALRGDTARAVMLLQLAVDRGWRRAWWMRRDPALEALRGDGAFSAMLKKIDGQLNVQRKNVGG